MNVTRTGEEKDLKNVSSVELVPGDIVEITDDCLMPCDLILLSGQCIMNEAMLTGESIPVIKQTLPDTNDVYNMVKDSKFTLFGGTHVIQTRNMGATKVIGLVIKTAF